MANDASVTSDQTTSVTSFLGRDRLARLVVLGSFLTIFLLVGTLVVVSEGANSSTTDMVEKTFNTILPVLAAWVGTVLAFYFSAHSLERTINSLDKAMGQAAGTGTTVVTVAQKMIPLASIRSLYDLANDAPETIKLTDLPLRAKESAAGGPVTRLIFVDKGVFKYVLHVGTLDAFLVKNAARAADLTMADLLNDPDSLQQISKFVVFVRPSASLRDAKVALDSVTGAQDVIVTDTGSAGRPILGWMTNNDLMKALTAS